MNPSAWDDAGAPSAFADGGVDPDDPNVAWQRIRSSQQFLPVPQTGPQRSSDCTRLVLISDTHGKHRQVLLPRGDCLIHAGDCTKSGELGTLQDLDAYFQDSGFSQAIAIAGNHDITLHPSFYADNWHRFHRQSFDVDACRAALRHCTYLEDSSCLLTHSSGSLGGIQFYGTPWSPEFYNWAFNLSRGGPIRTKWRTIPTSTDVLVVHGPPLGRGDKTDHSGHAGCADLLNEIQGRIRPRLVVFGHVHEGRGVSFDGRTVFVNASNLNSHYQAANQPFVVDLPHDTSKPAMIVAPHCQVQGSELKAWLSARGFVNVVSAISDDHAPTLPSRNDLLNDTAHRTLCESWLLHRDPVARKELHTALSQLYVESFEERRESSSRAASSSSTSMDCSL